MGLFWPSCTGSPQARSHFQRCVWWLSSFVRCGQTCTYCHALTPTQLLPACDITFLACRTAIVFLRMQFSALECRRLQSATHDAEYGRQGSEGGRKQLCILCVLHSSGRIFNPATLEHEASLLLVWKVVWDSAKTNASVRNSDWVMFWEIALWETILHTVKTALDIYEETSLKHLFTAEFQRLAHSSKSDWQKKYIDWMFCISWTWCTALIGQQNLSTHKTNYSPLGLQFMKWKMSQLLFEWISLCISLWGGSGILHLKKKTEECVEFLSQRWMRGGQLVPIAMAVWLCVFEYLPHSCERVRFQHI